MCFLLPLKTKTDSGSFGYSILKLFCLTLSVTENVGAFYSSTVILHLPPFATLSPTLRLSVAVTFPNDNEMQHVKTQTNNRNDISHDWRDISANIDDTLHSHRHTRTYARTLVNVYVLQIVDKCIKRGSQPHTAHNRVLWLHKHLHHERFKCTALTLDTWQTPNNMD